MKLLFLLFPILLNTKYPDRPFVVLPETDTFGYSFTPKFPMTLKHVTFTFHKMPVSSNCRQISCRLNFELLYRPKSQPKRLDETFFRREVSTIPFETSTMARIDLPRMDPLTSDFIYTWKIHKDPLLELAVGSFDETQLSENFYYSDSFYVNTETGRNGLKDFVGADFGCNYLHRAEYKEPFIPKELDKFERNLGVFGRGEVAEEDLEFGHKPKGERIHRIHLGWWGLAVTVLALFTISLFSLPLFYWLKNRLLCRTRSSCILSPDF